MLSGDKRSPRHGGIFAWLRDRFGAGTNQSVPGNGPFAPATWRRWLPWRSVPADGSQRRIATHARRRLDAETAAMRPLSYGSAVRLSDLDTFEDRAWAIVTTFCRGGRLIEALQLWAWLRQWSDRCNADAMFFATTVLLLLVPASSSAGTVAASPSPIDTAGLRDHAICLVFEALATAHEAASMERLLDCLDVGEATPAAALPAHREAIAALLNFGAPLPDLATHRLRAALEVCENRLAKDARA